MDSWEKELRDTLDRCERKDSIYFGDHEFSCNGDTTNCGLVWQHENIKAALEEIDKLRDEINNLHDLNEKNYQLKTGLWYE